MAEFKEYIASAGTSGALSDVLLDELIRRYEWFTPARIIRSVQWGAEDGRLCVAVASRALTAIRLLPVDATKLTAVSSEDLIDRFLQEDDLRIVAQEGEPETEICTEALLEDEDDLVSEELAEIYLAQGLRDEAEVIYRKLSLRNPEKSVYFAELIKKLKTNN